MQQVSAVLMVSETAEHMKSRWWAPGRQQGLYCTAAGWGGSQTVGCPQLPHQMLSLPAAQGGSAGERPDPCPAQGLLQGRAPQEGLAVP